MIQPQTQTEAYWVSKFTLAEKDIEQIYNYFLEVEAPQTLEEITRAVMAARVAEERNEVKRLVEGHTVYQPQKSYKVGETLVFPMMRFANGAVKSVRKGINPEYGEFSVIGVQIGSKVREFAAELNIAHPLNVNEGLLLEPTTEVDLDALYDLYGKNVASRIAEQLLAHPEFVNLAHEWFVRGLMMDISIGHKHLTEAVLEVHGGGPLPPLEILPHLDLGEGTSQAIQAFSLNAALQADNRFDEVGPRGVVTWFLRRMEPADVLETPLRLRYETIHHDRALLNTPLLMLERELDDEWSDLETVLMPQPIEVTLTYGHRSCGTLPLSSRVRQLFPLGKAERQRITFIDDQSGESVVGWVVREGRYIAGLGGWYSRNEIPIGGYLQLHEGEKPGEIRLNFQRQRAQKEWVNLAFVEEGRLRFKSDRRSIGCAYDDLLLLGTDHMAAMDAIFKQVADRRRSIPSLLAELFESLEKLSVQNQVHAKTLYSAINIMRRVPPGPLFAELVRHPAFQPVGDHYWQFVSSRWQRE